jgi:methylmalonic aciduria homocystinuria type C protein
MPPFERARDAQVGREGISDTWPLWLAVRDACPIGRAHRYDDAQIRYHYARDRSALCSGGL